VVAEGDAIGEVRRGRAATGRIDDVRRRVVVAQPAVLELGGLRVVEAFLLPGIPAAKRKREPVPGVIALAEDGGRVGRLRAVVVDDLRNAVERAGTRGNAEAAAEVAVVEQRERLVLAQLLMKIVEARDPVEILLALGRPELLRVGVRLDPVSRADQVEGVAVGVFRVKLLVVLP
jgi:hypothetical protein